MDLRRRPGQFSTQQRRPLSQGLGSGTGSAPNRSRPVSAPRRKGGPPESSSIWSKENDRRPLLDGPPLARKASAPSLGPPPSRWSGGSDQGSLSGHGQAAPSSMGYDGNGRGLGRPGMPRSSSATQVGPRNGGYAAGVRPGAASAPRRRPQAAGPGAASFDGGYASSYGPGGSTGGHSSFLDRDQHNRSYEYEHHNRSYQEGFASRNEALQLEVSLTERLREHSRSLLVDHSRTSQQDHRQQQMQDDRGSGQMRGERGFDGGSRSVWHQDSRDPAPLPRYRFDPKPNRGFTEQGGRQGSHGPQLDGRQDRSYDRGPGHAGMRSHDDRSVERGPGGGGRPQDDRSFERGPGGSRPLSAASMHSQGPGGDRAGGRPRRPASAQDQHRTGTMSRNADEKRPDSRTHSPEKHRGGEVKRGGEGFHTASTMTPLSTATEISRGDNGLGGAPSSLEGRMTEDMGLPESRLKIYSDLFEEVIERDKVFGSLLRKIKTAYDSLLRPVERRPPTMQMEAPMSGTSGAGPMHYNGSEAAYRHPGRGVGQEDQVGDERPQVRELSRQNRVLKDLVERLHLELEDAVKREQKYRNKAARLSADVDEVGSPSAAASKQHSGMKPPGAAPHIAQQFPGFNAMRREPPSSADLESSGVLNQGGLLSLSSISPQPSGQYTESLEASRAVPPVQNDPLDDTRSDLESLDSEMLPQKPTHRRCPKPKNVPSLDFTKLDDHADESDGEDGGLIPDGEGYSDEDGGSDEDEMHYGEGDSSPPGSPNYKGERPGDPVSQTLANEESRLQLRGGLPAFLYGDSNSEDGLHDAEEQD